MKSLVLAALLLPLPALACDKGEKPVFSCVTTKGKEIKVCQATTAITYSFGKPGQPPELTLSEDNGTFDYLADSGSGMGTEYLNFKNGKTRYNLEIFTVFDRQYSDSKTEFSESASLNVMQGGKSLAVLDCKEPTIKFDPSAIVANAKKVE